MIADIEGLSGMSDADLSSLLARCSLETIAVAIHGVDPDLKKRMLRALGFFARMRLKSMPVYRTIVPLRDVENAHADIVSAANR
jgi:flagellar motor switch protein FliG